MYSLTRLYRRLPGPTHARRRQSASPLIAQREGSLTRAVHSPTVVSRYRITCVSPSVTDAQAIRPHSAVEGHGNPGTRSHPVTNLVRTQRKYPSLSQVRFGASPMMPWDWIGIVMTRSDTRRNGGNSAGRPATLGWKIRTGASRSFSRCTHRSRWCRARREILIHQRRRRLRHQDLPPVTAATREAR